MKTFARKTPGHHKQSGVVMASELAVLNSVMVVGMVTGLATMRDAATAEMEDVAEAIGQLDQSFAIAGLRSGHGSAVSEGSSFGDAIDRNAGDTVSFSFTPNDHVEGQATIPESLRSSESSSAGRR